MDQLMKLGPFQAASKFWNSLSGTQRFISAVFISTSIVLLAIVSVVATRPRMTVLFAGLQSEDAGAVVAKLQEKRIPYVVDGSAIKVPEKYVHETRMELAGQGLPAGGSVGFEIFDKSNLGMTEFAQRLNYQRAMQGELARSIDQLRGVIQSRVHIAIPEESIFTDTRKEPTASVIVKLNPGSALDSDKVGSIVHLVSSAVEGLRPNHVTVVDTNGNVLSEATDEATGLDPRLSGSQLKLKAEHERQVVHDIQSMLERVLGANKAIVRVNAKINFDRKETSSEIYQPIAADKGIVMSEERLEESYNGSSGTVGGVVGTRANLRPSGPMAAAGTSAGGGYQRLETTNKYEVSKTTEHVVKAPGQIEKLAVAVLVDGRVDASKLPAIRSAVATASGIDLKRGDQITVESMTFDNSAIKKEEKELQAMASRSTYLSIGKSVGGVLLLLGFLFFLRTMLKQVKITIPEPVVVQEVTAAQTPVQGYAPPPGFAASGEDGSPARNVPQQPEEVAQVVRKWMSES
jgi:flagellar M-ring protein FliF